ncbi:AAA domain-containing protein [Candidatus Nitrotoga arctica]|uniref:DNA2/NAM7 helicase helicase domain-containing protein n=1 Tax=Candidatus Nitrotoga arctica TaxID=453162 RepID=A0ABN8AK55_9PROT|nr:AAA domain-containing protein [Candidatus Nitrotoga arctica]CAG9931402.1 protein of unknown function [Candidatus Nitrotoga arctica]
MSNVIKSKVRQLYHFLKEANQLRFRPVRVLGEQPKVVRLADMPSHPSMQVFRPVRVENTPEIPDTLLRIKRPTTTRCPAPPQTITSWLLPNWDDPSKAVAYAESLNATDDDDKTITILFDDDEQRVSDYADWIELRNAWVAPELAARKAMRFFEVFYDIYSTIEKDGEQLELLVADGHFSWQTTSGVDGLIVIDHPVLLKRIELRFDPNVPEFTIHETDREAELYGSLFVDLQDIAPATLQNRKSDLESSGYHPLGWEDTEAFLKAFIQTVSPLNGEFLNKPSTEAASTTPRLWRDPVLLLRKRVAGIANAVDAIIDDIDHRSMFPSSLAQITGTMDSWEGSGLSEGLGGSGSGTEQAAVIPPVVFNDDDILLAKEANDAQLQIIRRLNHSGSVLVQGPPGTGKTHTIGNLIGHLLAQGKSILVTAQTAKALRVLLGEVPKELQPLCVSVLGSDNDARGNWGPQSALSPSG